MSQRLASAGFIPPGILPQISFFRVEGPVPLAVIKRLQAGVARKNFVSPMFIGCGKGIYVADTRDNVFPVIAPEWKSNEIFRIRT